ncbi:Uncharacterised protein [Chlamydia trachomatis]|nr:Uncharacterised protein [Chlamydia trachomatis]
MAILLETCILVCQAGKIMVRLRIKMAIQITTIVLTNPTNTIQLTLLTQAQISTMLAILRFGRHLAILTKKTHAGTRRLEQDAQVGTLNAQR